MMILVKNHLQFSSVQFSSVRTFILRRSNSLYSHECYAVKSCPRRPNGTATFSVCVGIVRVSGLRYGSFWGIEFHLVDHDTVLRVFIPLTSIWQHL